MGIKLGLVGCGAFGSQFIALAKHHPLVDRFALCDQNPDKLKERGDQHEVAERYASLDELCRSDLDAVMLITQPWLHAKQAVQVMESGKHAYSAVPVSASLDAIDQVIRTCERTGQYYMMGETSYFRRECAWLREKAQAGAFGELIYLEAEYLHDLDHGLREVAKWRWAEHWGPDKTGGVPMHYPSHSVCYPVSITGSRMTHVSCLGYRYPNDDWFREDTMSGCVFSNEVGLFEHENGAKSRICEFRRVGHRGAERCVRVYGTEASFEAGLTGAVWCTKDKHEPVVFPAEVEPLPEPLASDKGGHGGSHAYLVNEFVNAVAAGRQPRLNAWVAARYCAPGIIAHQSALRDGERLPIPDWGDAPA